jgi:ABC-type bacteriocin/lantibiotic exporter with double-glycine peptidase domain
LTSSFLNPLNGLVTYGGQLQQARANMARLDDVLAYPPQWAAVEGPTCEAAILRKLSGSLELRNVTFGYSILEEPLIKDFSLRLEVGQRVALVGSSGSGKSTVARLVGGLFQPWSGTILLDGVAREEVPRDILRSSLAMVDQNVFLFEGTVRSNLTLWDPTVPEEVLRRALQDAAISDMVMARPGGLDSPLSEGGANLSGGERQRLEIARALAVDPTLIILDEATSALDPIVEKAIDARLRSRGCTCLMVAHRLSTIRDCDEIIVLERGRVVERGSHQEMVGHDGPYRRLIEAEFTGDREES